LPAGGGKLLPTKSPLTTPGSASSSINGVFPPPSGSSGGGRRRGLLPLFSTDHNLLYLYIL
jgi:hypothetical protein